MGPVNWLAVMLAALVGALIAGGWYVWLFRGGRAPKVWHLPLLLVPAALMGHNFARVGVAVLEVKPWLYWMMSGGFALAVILPAQVITQGRHAIPARAGWIDAGYWLVSFLAMGTVFWALR